MTHQSKHSYKVGDHVVVWNQTFSGRTICEGRATVRRILDRDDTYMVQFDGDGPRDLFERRVELDAADLPNDDPRVQPAPQSPISMGRSIAAEIPTP
jgi:hypothetical protein